jgi:hypothetical protein
LHSCCSVGTPEETCRIPAQPQSLLDYPAELSEAEFRIEERADSYLIGVQGKRLMEKYLGSQAAFGFEDVPTNATDLALSRQLKKALRQQGIRPEGGAEMGGQSHLKASLAI